MVNWNVSFENEYLLPSSVAAIKINYVLMNNNNKYTAIRKP